MSNSSDEILDRMMRLHPKVIDLTLDRMRPLLAALGHPEQRLPPVVHIAGTNGKGSTQAMISTGLRAAGMRVHAYTSPHLVRFHERISLCGKPIDEAALGHYLERCYVANGGAQITYFEITTIAAILAMSETPADYCLLEVGLGGRYDATNVIDKPALSIITPIDLDHQGFLGDSIEEIAAEKAGILKTNVTAIIAPQNDAALSVIERKAQSVGAPLLVAGQDWQINPENDRLVFLDDTGLLDLPMPSLRGPHQRTNAGTAVAALRRLGISSQACETAVAETFWSGRMQKITRSSRLGALNPQAELWLDGGHNPAAGRALAASLAELPPRPVRLICGMLNSKDLDGYLRPLADVTKTLVAVSIPGEANTIPAHQTADAARDAGFEEITASTVSDALASTRPGERVVICGSLYLVGHILREYGG